MTSLLCIGSLGQNAKASREPEQSIVQSVKKVLLTKSLGETFIASGRPSPVADSLQHFFGLGGHQPLQQ